MRLLPRTLFGRLVLLMASGLVLAQLIGAVMHPIARAVGIGVHGSKVAATMAADPRPDSLEKSPRAMP